MQDGDGAGNCPQLREERVHCFRHRPAMLAGGERRERFEMSRVELVHQGQRVFGVATPGKGSDLQQLVRHTTERRYHHYGSREPGPLPRVFCAVG